MNSQSKGYGAMVSRRAMIVSIAVCLVLSRLTSQNARAEDNAVRIVVLGDSHTAGSGIAVGYRFTDQLEFALRAKGKAVVVLNAGVVHDTAVNGLTRLDRAVPDGTHAVILQLGGTDMLRGTDPNVTRAALAAILQNLQARRIVALLCGARPHTNFGHEYEKAFAAMFAGLASEYNVLLYDAFDDAFVDDPQLKALGGLHPNPAGLKEVVTRILPKVEALIGRVSLEDR
ncbi:GDSL-type esterase/lipase family protein [Bradyrhizobium sp. 172]|uniref:GDSL-type esterase/lipase family protein n=1 Tax=Bradyrhizobium sp. 172 TaxID=2782643 RepID=UPI001FFE70C6|nr:GDSL-type esterase/lipase family protein [Bradyrhizobium sp. 172]UPJ97408.1 lysophospholipase [Bradyrhizobium sp. 172]